MSGQRTGRSVAQVVAVKVIDGNSGTSLLYTAIADEKVG